MNAGRPFFLIPERKEELLKTKLRLFSLILLLGCITTAVFAEDEALQFPAPQYMLPMYDHFTCNYLNAEALGRGFTTIAMPGGLENAVNNPATLTGDKTAFYLQVAAKPPINEINEDSDQSYTAPIPFGIFGVSTKIYKNWLGAISYNIPKSVVYDAYDIYYGQGMGFVSRNPTYYLHQFTATLSGKTGNFKYGLNVQQQLHQFNDIIVFYTFDRVDKTYYVVRWQPGLLYTYKNYRVGLTFLAPAEKKMDIRYLEYDTKFPMKISGGLAADFDNNKISLDADWEQFSEMDSKFDDRLTLKLGMEKRLRNNTFRLGLMSMPGVFEGDYLLPQKPNATSNDTMWWNALNPGGTIDNTDQLYLTFGYTYYFKGGRLTLSAARDVLNNVPTTQIAMALAFNAEAIKGKKFLFID